VSLMASREPWFEWLLGAQLRFREPRFIAHRRKRRSVNLVPNPCRGAMPGSPPANVIMQVCAFTVWCRQVRLDFWDISSTDLPTEDRQSNGVPGR
jgi:hypothetical protein